MARHAVPRKGKGGPDPWKIGFLLIQIWNSFWNHF
jgi:hypothetical protein